MKILHTSDWHLGRLLYTKKRYDESEAFLAWLIDFIKEEGINILLVAGDIFDTTTPSNKAQELYYNFLGRVSRTSCRHVVITGGNHDSPTFLEAPKTILSALDVHVIGAVSENPEDEVLELRNDNGKTEAIICAVPFLRDRDVRSVDPGENPGDKNEKMLKGIASHYKAVVDIAKNLKGSTEIPLIGMGHLFTRDAKTTEGDGVRELYIGTLAHIDQEAISEGFDYMALGHLHLAQCAGNCETVRYSGSPMPMGFAEAEHTKKVVVIEFNNAHSPIISEHAIPCFQELIRLSGDLQTVSENIGELITRGSKAWLEVEITSENFETNLSTYFEELLSTSSLEILRVKTRQQTEIALRKMDPTETLETLDPTIVFERCLDAYEVPDESRSRLLETYKEVITYMQTEDSNAS